MAALKLAGQVAWIGGGASGIGAAVARLFAAEGARGAGADVQTELGGGLVCGNGRGGGRHGAVHVLRRCAGGRSPRVNRAIARSIRRTRDRGELRRGRPRRAARTL